ncbi:hypothetical protein [Burkholderia pseudomallei]|uniref:hypothetical protein n=1 Tax=Burkholderia pseudomallei TaxID=28450 RepID=UPI00015F7C3E|nr:hypothetical protein [Burkholderia pseudomallei]AJX59693.1 hypothetical protein DP47_3443 [Burkholderia pseudomallei Pasteur 52237]EDO95269.1 hypothetical protein BURPSPAST_M0054 [Burkholderia pseudomallei Pasteur 52237]
MSERIVTRCRRCRKETDVFGSSWCAGCYYPGIDADWQRYLDLVEEGYSRYQARVMAGLSDPDEVSGDTRA